MWQDQIDAISKLHQTDNLGIVLAITGGGTEAIPQLLVRGGASKTVLEATVPYAQESSDIYTGKEPEHYVSQNQAVSLAMAAYSRGKIYAPTRKIWGLGSTSKLLKVSGERPHRSHDIHVVLQTDYVTELLFISLIPGRTRFVEEQINRDAILLMLTNHEDSDEICTRLYQEKIISQSETATLKRSYVY